MSHITIHKMCQLHELCKSIFIQKSTGADCAYVGFIIAVFGAVPLLVGAFIDVPNLWEVGLGLTLLGLFIGVTFSCWNFCVKEATKELENFNGNPARRRIRAGRINFVYFYDENV
jgi:hypothetical protein